MIGSRVVLIPVIAAVGYEILRAGARHRRNPLVHAILMPGIWVQKITTRQPTDDMIEVAIVSLEEALLADGETVPEGSADFARAPLDPPVVPDVAAASEAEAPTPAEGSIAAIPAATATATAAIGPVPEGAAGRP